MQLMVTGRHMDVTEAVKVYITDKIKDILKKHSTARITKVHVILEVEKFRHIAEIELHGPKTNLYSKTTAEDMYASIDQAVNKIERQIVKYKAKFDDNKHKKHETIRIPENEEEK